jgi:hypothetical protein
MECNKRIKGISERLISILQSINPDHHDLIDDDLLTDAERNELHALNTTITLASMNLYGVEKKRQAIYQAARERAGQ